MIFLPIGHDQTIRRFPWLTVAIMVVCTVLQFARVTLGPSDRDLFEATREADTRGYALIDRMHAPPSSEAPDEYEVAPPNAPPPIALPPELAQADSPKLLEAVRAGKLGDPNDPGVAAYKLAAAHLEDVKNRDLGQRFGYRPSSGASINLLLAAFMHGGFLHLAGNMLFLWLCGCNLEDRWGRLAFGGVYALAAIVSSLAYGLVHRGSDVPLVGASGAIAGAMGAFLVCFHAARIKYWWWWYFKSGTIFLPAYVAFPVWFLSQLGQSLLEASGFGGVAYSAHVGGFVFGVLAALIIRFGGLERFLAPDDDDEGLVEEQPLPGPVAATALGYVKSPSIRPYVAPSIHKSESNYAEDPAILRPRVSSEPPRGARGSSQPAPFGPMSHSPEIPAAPKLPEFGGAALAEVPDVAPWPPPFIDKTPLEAARQALEAEPNRDDLRYDLCKLAIAAGDPELVDLTATRTFLWLAEQERWRDIVAMYDSIGRSGLDRPLSDRAWSMVVRAAVETNDPKLCVQSAQKMANAHPQSPLLPRALWDVGNAQARGGRPDFARRTFQMLIERFPQHRFADEARKQLT